MTKTHILVTYTISAICAVLFLGSITGDWRGHIDFIGPMWFGGVSFLAIYHKYINQ